MNAYELMTFGSSLNVFIVLVYLTFLRCSVAMTKETVDIGTPWVERYRPKNLQEVSHQSEVVATLQNAVETGRLPHLLLYG